MAALKTNKIIPVMVVAFVLMAGAVFFKATKPKVAKPVVADAGEASLANRKADETLEMNKQLIDRLDTVMDEKDEMEDDQELMITKELEEQQQKQSKQFDMMMAKMSRMVDEMGQVKTPTLPVLPAQSIESESVPMEIPEGFGVNIQAGDFVSGEDLIEVFWIEPLDESINNRLGANGRSFIQTTAEESGGDTKADEAKALLMKPLNSYRDLIDNVSEEEGIIGKSSKLFKPATNKQMSVKGFKIVEIGASYRGGPIKRQTRTGNDDNNRPSVFGSSSTRNDNNRSSVFGSSRNNRNRVVSPTTEAFFTIPDLSILSGAIATTSLVGRIYPDGNVVDPQFFKLIVGRENFTANFQALPPEIEGMIFEGFGVGEFSTRCISGRIVAATFIFEDGTTRSMYPGDPGSRPDAGGRGRTMGYITDPFGNPCVSGKLITDAAEFIATGGALAFASAAAAAVQESARTTTETFGETGAAGNRTTNVTGNTGEFAVASGVNAALDRGLVILDELFSRSQALIYAPSGASVDIHLQQELRLDIGSNARKIRYRKNVNRQTELD